MVLEEFVTNVTNDIYKSYSQAYTGFSYVTDGA
jgi:hypothetical protein